MSFLEICICRFDLTCACPTSSGQLVISMLDFHASSSNDVLTIAISTLSVNQHTVYWDILVVLQLQSHWSFYQSIHPYTDIHGEPSACVVHNELTCRDSAKTA